MPIALVIGGARSGKSRFVERWAQDLAPNPIYVATSRHWDQEHSERIERHRRERAPCFHTVEEEKHIARAGQPGRVLAIDCVTLWLTNWFHDAQSDVEYCLEQVDLQLRACSAMASTTWLFVTNELGQGVHPENALARRFIDLQGFANQRLAARADTVVWMVAGLPQTIKGASTALGVSAGRVSW